MSKRKRLAKHVEGLCTQFYADDGRLGLPPAVFPVANDRDISKAWMPNARSPGEPQTRFALRDVFLTKLARASGIETPTRADLTRFDRKRKN